MKRGFMASSKTFLAQGKKKKKKLFTESCFSHQKFDKPLRSTAISSSKVTLSWFFLSQLSTRNFAACVTLPTQLGSWMGCLIPGKQIKARVNTSGDLVWKDLHFYPKPTMLTILCDRLRHTHK